MGRYRITGKLLRNYQKEIVMPLLTRQKQNALIVQPRRSGKSFTNFYLVNALINQYYVEDRMPVNSTIFAPEQKQCREIYIDNIMSDGRKMIDISNGKFMSSRLSIEYEFGSKIKFTGSDKIDSAMGAGNKIVILDEAALGKPEAFQRLYPMVQQTNGHMIVTSTPRGRNHFYELYEMAKNNPKWLVIKEDVFSLGLMTQQEYDEIPMDENYKRQEFLCSWDSPFENAIYSEPNVEKLVITNAAVYISFDLGIGDATAIVIAQVVNDNIRIIKTLEFVNTSLEDSCSQLTQWLRDNNLLHRRLFLPHDASVRDLITGRSRFDYVHEQGFNTQLVERRGLMDGIDIVRRNWHRIIFQDGDKSIERVKAYVMDKYTKKPKHDDNSHMADAIRYLVVGIENDRGIEIVTNYEKQYYRNNQYSRSL